MKPPSRSSRAKTPSRYKGNLPIVSPLNSRIDSPDESPPTPLNSLIDSPDECHSPYYGDSSLSSHSLPCVSVAVADADEPMSNDDGDENTCAHLSRKRKSYTWKQKRIIVSKIQARQENENLSQNKACGREGIHESPLPTLG